jgi:hypothetical protein
MVLTSVPTAWIVAQVPERGARMARRDDREYRKYLREEQRRQPGCPARELCHDPRGRDTRLGSCGFQASERVKPTVSQCERTVLELRLGMVSGPVAEVQEVGRPSERAARRLYDHRRR